MSSRYVELLLGGLKPLGHFADELLSIKNNREFFRYIVDYIVPVVQKSSDFERFYFKWLQEKDAYLKERIQLQTNIPLEIEQAYATLRSKLQNTDFLRDPRCAKYLDTIEEMLGTKKPEGMPSYIDLAEGKIKQLLCVLLDLGAEDIVKDYAVIVDANEARINPQTNEWEYFKRGIAEFTFAPSIVQLRKLEITFFSDGSVTNTWVGWEFLSLVKWCWDTPFSFFSGKDLNFKSYASSQESLYWLMLRGHWGEINNLKENNEINGRAVPFFEKTKFTGYIKRILDDIILEQAIEYQEIDNATVESEIVSPYSIELSLHYTDLFLDVCWSEYSGNIRYLIYSFQDGKGPYDFMVRLTDAPGKDIAILPMYKGGSVAKYLGAAKLHDTILGNVFFTQTNTLTACLKSKSIKGTDLSQSDREALKNFIKKNFNPMPDNL